MAPTVTWRGARSGFSITQALRQRTSASCELVAVPREARGLRKIVSRVAGGPANVGACCQISSAALSSNLKAFHVHIHMRTCEESDALITTPSRRFYAATAQSDGMSLSGCACVFFFYRMIMYTTSNKATKWSAERDAVGFEVSI